MTETADQWFKLTTACVPLLASAGSAAFLFANRNGRRIERLKNLVQISTALPDQLNPNHAVQRAILWQLWGIELWVTPWFRLVKRYLYVAGALFLLLFVVGTASTSLGLPENTAAAIRWVSVGLAVVFPIPPYVAYERHRGHLSNPYKAAFEALDHTGGQRDSAPDDSNSQQ